MTEIVSPWGPPVEERPPIPDLEEMAEEMRAKREAKIERRATKRQGHLIDEDDGEQEPTLEERHTNVIGGPEVIGGEERVVLEREMRNQ